MRCIVKVGAVLLCVMCAIILIWGSNGMRENLLAEILGLAASIFVAIWIVERYLECEKERQWQAYQNLVYLDLAAQVKRLLWIILPWGQVAQHENEVWSYGKKCVWMWKLPSAEEFGEELDSLSGWYEFGQRLENKVTRDFSTSRDDGLRALIEKFGCLGSDLRSIRAQIRDCCAPATDIYPKDFAVLVRSVLLEISGTLEGIDTIIARMSRPKASPDDAGIVANASITSLAEAAVKLFGYLQKNATLVETSAAHFKRICDKDLPGAATDA